MADLDHQEFHRPGRQSPEFRRYPAHSRPGLENQEFQRHPVRNRPGLENQEFQRHPAHSRPDLKKALPGFLLGPSRG